MSLPALAGRSRVPFVVMASGALNHHAFWQLREQAMQRCELPVRERDLCPGRVPCAVEAAFTRLPE